MERLIECHSEFNRILKENDEIYREAAKALNLPDCAFWIIYCLREANAPLTQRDICAATFQPKQTVNSALKKLADEGCLALSCGSDRRSKQVHLTEKGVSLAKKTVDRVIEAECHALSGFSQEDQDAFLSLFQKYTGLLKENMQALGDYK